MISVFQSCKVKCVVCLFAYMVFSVAMCSLLVCMFFCFCFFKTIHDHYQILAIILVFYFVTIRTLSDNSLLSKILIESQKGHSLPDLEVKERYKNIYRIVTKPIMLPELPRLL